MKRVISYLYIICCIVSLFALDGCGAGENSSEVVSSDESMEISSAIEETSESSEEIEESFDDPFVTELVDKSTGAVKPRLVKTLYETDDVVIADIIPTEDGYAVSNDGIGDSTAGIQKALNDCYDNGGGTVYLPAGQYAISGEIFIPPFVTLRGDWQDADVGNEYGTVILVYTPSDESFSKGETVTEGTFMLGGSGGVVGLTVYYPHQNLRNVKPYPFTFYTDGKGANYMLSTLKNITVLNGYRGIGACCLDTRDGGGAHEQLTVENFKGTFLYCGTEVYNQADVGTWQDVSVSNKYWIEAKGAGIKAADSDALNAFTKKNATGLKLGDLEWTEFEGLKVSGCKVGIEIVKGKRIRFAGSMMDIEILDCNTGILLRELDGRWGMLIARGVIEGGINNKSTGVVKLCDVKVTGTTKGKIDQTATDVLAQYLIDYKRSYVKPTNVLYTATLDKSGKTDVSAQLQAVIDQASSTGGVVYISAGNYRIDNPIAVPEGVELRGATSVAVRDQNGLSRGTVLYCYYGDGDAFNSEKDAALITLAGKNSGVNGVRIIYPQNGLYDTNLNTTYTIRGTAEGVYVVNSAITASGYGIDFRDCDKHFIKKVTTCCYYNSYRLGGKEGMLGGCLQNGTAVYRTERSNGLLENWPADEAQIWNELFNPITRISNKYIILDAAEEQQIYNTFIYGASNMIECNDSIAIISNVGADNLGGAQLVMNSGKMVAVNVMRYNGTSYRHKGGIIELYNRLTINNKTEATEIIGE